MINGDKPSPTPSDAQSQDETLVSPVRYGKAGEVTRQIGHYLILRVIGEGGMGTVYEAQQDRPRRTVALKVIKPGLATPSVIRRFELESQVLGRLQHPGIAQIYEAGMADTGLGPQPYFAMEMVRGQSLLDYALSHSLSSNERLELMARICDAVHYAHQKGVIHRDLKPGNILVTEEETTTSTRVRETRIKGTSGVGQPKILDFGIARATDSDVAVTTMHTSVGEIMGTVQYMSPEQVAGDAASLDTRSDVYALGVIAYELLANKLPYQVARKLLHEAARIIQEEDPQPLSVVHRTFRGDVETIVGKAMAKDRQHRYHSAAEMAADIRRHLADEPIVARPPSAMYQLRKFAKRNKGLVGGVLGAFAVLIVASVVSTVLAIQATRARSAEAAQRERAEKNLAAAIGAVDKYLTNVSESADLKAAGLEPLRRKLLGTAKDFYSDFVQQRSDDPKLLREYATAYQRLGIVDNELGDFAEAESAMRKGLELCDELEKQGWDPVGLRQDRLANYNNLGQILARTGRNAESEAMYRKAIALEAGGLEESAGADFTQLLLASTYDNLGTLSLATRNIEEAEKNHLKGLELRRKLVAKEPDNIQYQNEVSISNVNLGTLYAMTDRPKEALPHLEEAVRICEHVHKKFPLVVHYQNAMAAALNNLGGVYTLLGDNKKAFEVHEQSLALREKMATEHPAVIEYSIRLASSYTNLGEIDVREKQPERGLQWLDKAVTILEEILAGLPREATARYYLSYTQSWRAQALEAMNRFDDALAAWDRAIALDDRNDPTLRAGREATQNMATKREGGS